MQDLGSFLQSIPPITRWLLLLSLCFPVASKLHLINPYLLVLSWTQLKRFQLWRLVTPFFLTGINLNYLYALFVRYTYSSMLETDNFSCQEEDYLYFLLLSALTMVTGGVLAGLGSLWSCMNICIVYLWSKLNSEREVSFLFGIKIKAFYLPFAMALVDLVSGASPYNSLVGIGAGHLYYFGQFVYPNHHQGRKLFATPNFFKRLFNALSKPVPQGQTKYIRSATGYTVYEPINRPQAQPSSSGKFIGKGRKLQ